jgi:hypothetical protein
MKWIATAVALMAVLAGTQPAMAGPSDEARALYARFVIAQNASDFAAVETLLLDSQQFLWVTNGIAIWGHDAAIRRMQEYHKAEIWHIEPVAAKTVAVAVTDSTAFVNVPLELTIGANKDGPDRFKFLVSALCVATSQGWRIAALFTTTANDE